MTINWDGSVVPCCLDYEGEIILGNVKNQTLKEIWLGDGFKQFRKKLLKDINSVDMCKKCRMRLLNSHFPYLMSIFWR
jgi:radical SAM protein with 4Fe4S-binding SPASM domain